MQRVRLVFDPRSLCNPGKIFPTPRLCGEVPGPCAAIRPKTPASPSECRGVVSRELQTTADPPATDIVQPSTAADVAAAMKRRPTKAGRWSFAAPGRKWAGAAPPAASTSCSTCGG
jgi:hypothetical protein